MDNQAKVGDLVQLKSDSRYPTLGFPLDGYVGMIIGFDGCEPVVFWNEKFPNETEYKEQLEVIND
jgi:hypothetical protein